jgi:hypothetical protein
LPRAMSRNACSDCAIIARVRSFLWIEWYLDAMAQSSKWCGAAKDSRCIGVSENHVGTIQFRKVEPDGLDRLLLLADDLRVLHPDLRVRAAAVITRQTRAPNLPARQKACGQAICRKPFLLLSMAVRVVAPIMTWLRRSRPINRFARFHTSGLPLLSLTSQDVRFN